MPTVKDVASRANVSPGTVSNVLTGKRPVSAATRARVLQVIEELGYQPNVLARSLINRRSETIAVVASGLDYFGPSQIVVGIERAASETGYSLLLRLIHWSDPLEAERALGALAGRQVDGIISGVIGLTSGIDLEKVRPDTYGSGPSSLALGPILNALNALNENAPWARSPAAKWTGSSGPRPRSATTAPASCLSTWSSCPPSSSSIWPRVPA